MIIRLENKTDVPIYVQLRNQIVMGIGKGELKTGEALPTVRQLAQDIGVNTMTVNKTYQILKLEGYIEIDRRKGATVCAVREATAEFKEKLEGELELLSAQACLKGYEKEEFLKLCADMFDRMNAASLSSQEQGQGFGGLVF